MSNEQGLSSYLLDEATRLGYLIDMENTNGEKLGIDTCKALISWGTELAAEILYTIKKKDINKGLGGVLKLLFRFGDDLAGLAPLISEFDTVIKELRDLNKQEAEALEEYLNYETAKNLERRGLDINDNSVDFVVEALEIAFKLVEFYKQQILNLESSFNNLKHAS